MDQVHAVDACVGADVHAGEPRSLCAFAALCDEGRRDGPSPRAPGTSQIRCEEERCKGPRREVPSDLHTIRIPWLHPTSHRDWVASPRHWHFLHRSYVFTVQ